MYFPKSQIKTNLYSNGDLVIKSTGETYIGYYWATSNGVYFSGKSPNFRSGVELIKGKNPNAKVINPSKPNITFDNIRYIQYSRTTLPYIKLAEIDTSNVPQLPTYYATLPTKEDYASHEFTRYFCKKNNEFLYIEISKEEFVKLNSQDSSLDYEQYIPFKLPWVLVGEQNKVAIENKNAIDYKELRNNFQGFGKYLKYNYLLYFESFN